MKKSFPFYPTYNRKSNFLVTVFSFSFSEFNDPLNLSTARIHCPVNASKVFVGGAFSGEQNLRSSVVGHGSGHVGVADVQEVAVRLPVAVRPEGVLVRVPSSDDDLFQFGKFEVGIGFPLLHCFRQTVENGFGDFFV